MASKQKTKIVYRTRVVSAAKRAGKKAGKGIFKNWGKISSGVGGLIFLNQVTGKDMEATANQPAEAQVKNFVNSFLGRTMGITVFRNGTPQYKQTFNIGGVFNKYTGLGAAMEIYSVIPAKLPLKGKIRTLGHSVLGGGIFGGVFSPDNKTSGAA